jgi:hypothetical protein
MLLGATRAHAEPPAAPPLLPAPAPAPSSAPPPDVVFLKDGSMFRGTIAELVRDDHVVIVTIIGDARRFPMAEVKYAGLVEAAQAPSECRAASQESRPVPIEPGAAPSVPVRFDTGGNGIASLHVWTYNPRSTTSRSPFQADQAICMAPCETTLPAGTYRFGVSGGPNLVEHVPQLFEVSGPMSLVGTYHDRRAIRISGWVLLGISAVVGTTLAVVGTTNQKSELQLAGAIGGLAGVGIGLALGLQPDGAKLVISAPNSPKR